MKGKRFRTVIVAAFALMALAVGLRIWTVNAQPVEGYPERHVGMGEWVDLDGTFFISAEDGTRGYSMRITDTRTMSCDEYLKTYGKKAVDIGGDLDAKTIVLLTYEVAVAENSGGAFLLYMHQLIPQRKNAAYQCDTALWDAYRPDLNGTMGFTVKPGTTASFVAPFTLLIEPKYLDTYNHDRRLAVNDSSFSLVVSNAPVRTVIDISVDS